MNETKIIVVSNIESSENGNVKPSIINHEDSAVGTATKLVI